MKQVTANVFVETELRGSNHGLVLTSDGLVLIDTAVKPSDAVRLKAEIARRGQLRYLVNTEPHGDHWTGNAFFDAPVIAHEGVRDRILSTDMAEHVARVASYGPDEPTLLEGYRPNVPVITFRSTMTLHVGNHTFRMMHMPGHTPDQAAVIVEEEGVVFTSDNIFCKEQTWLQEEPPTYGSQDVSRPRLPVQVTGRFAPNKRASPSLVRIQKARTEKKAHLLRWMNRGELLGFLRFLFEQRSRLRLGRESHLIAGHGGRTSARDRRRRHGSREHTRGLRPRRRVVRHDRPHDHPRRHAAGSLQSRYLGPRCTIDGRPLWGLKTPTRYTWNRDTHLLNLLTFKRS